MDLNEKAKETPDVDLARQSAPGAYRLETTELESADDVTPEGDFPQYGDFLRVLSPQGEQYVECPAGLARWLVENETEVGDGFRILSVQKLDGEWQYDVEALSDDDLARLEERATDR